MRDSRMLAGHLSVSMLARRLQEVFVLRVHQRSSTPALFNRKDGQEDRFFKEEWF